MTVRVTSLPAGSRGAARQRLVDLYLAIRVSTLGFTLMLPLLGMAFAPERFDAARAAWLLAAAFAFHVFAYMLNDVIDLDVDRTESQRADSPLVRGTWSPRVAATIAFAAGPASFVFAAAGDAPLRWLVLAFASMAVYDVWGKRCRWPVVTDAVQAVGWCALLCIGIAPGAATPAHAWIVGYVFACVLVVQGVHGGLRDLANDRRRGARTTAAWFGARERADGRLFVPAALLAYAGVLQAAMVVCAVGMFHVAGGDAPGVAGVAFWLAIAMMLAAAVGGAVVARRGHDRGSRLVNAGAWHIVAMLVVPLVLASSRLPREGLTLLWFVFVAPIVAMGAYNGTHWHMARDGAAMKAITAATPRAPASQHGLALLRLMRAHKPLCATAFVFLGAWLGAGSPDALLSVRVLLAALAVFCISAFGFVINDLCDVAVDAIGKPGRPLPSGQVSKQVAMTAAGVLALGGVVLSVVLGGSAAIIGVAATALAAAYSIRLKRTVLIGNASVATLISAVLVFGAIAAAPEGAVIGGALDGGMTGLVLAAITGAPAAVWTAAAVTFAFIVAQEALFTLEDEHDDRAAGYRTTATVLGTARATRLVRVLLMLFVVVALVPWLVGAGGRAYLVAVLACSIVPVLVILWWLREPLALSRVAAAVRLSRVVWVSGFVPLALLA